MEKKPINYDRFPWGYPERRKRTRRVIYRVEAETGAGFAPDRSFAVFTMLSDHHRLANAREAARAEKRWTTRIVKIETIETRWVVR